MLPGSAFSSTPVTYIADHDTAPPPGQVITTDPASLLLRTLQSRKAREEAKRKPTRADKGKRPAEDVAAGPSAKRSAGGAAAARSGGDGAGPSEAGPSGTSPPIPSPAESCYARDSLRLGTLVTLKAILKAWKLPQYGKKEELVNRILGHQAEAQQGQAMS